MAHQLAVGGMQWSGWGQCQVKEVAAHTQFQALGSLLSSAVNPMLSMSGRETVPLGYGTCWGSRIWKE